MTLLRPLEWGYPISASRNTDIPKFWMRRWFEWMDRGWVNAPHPQTGLPAQWSLKPEDLHSIIWWSKDYRPFLKHPRRAELDKNYRQFFNMTITGDELWELKVPDLDVQLAVFREMVSTYGVDKVRWRYSPIPLDWSLFGKILEAMAGMGVTECYYSFLHSDTKVKETRSPEERKEILLFMAEYAANFGVKMLGCWDDLQWVGAHPNVYEASCLDARVLDRVYGLEQYNIVHPVESNCGCSMSVEIGNQKLLTCPHACQFCYAAVDEEPNVGDSAGLEEGG